MYNLTINEMQKGLNWDEKKLENSMEKSYLILGDLVFTPATGLLV
jgi:hypothetical protein